MSHGKISEKNRKRRRKSSRTPKPIRFIIVVFTVFMTFLFLKGIVSFLTVPPQAKEEARQIEETLRIQQEEAERLRKQREEEMARAAAEEEARRKEEEEFQRLQEEELAANPLLGKYTDASELQVTGIGDSVMLGAISALYETFPNGYFDAVFGRTIYDGKKVLNYMSQNGTLGDVIVFSLGTNSYIEEQDMEDLIADCGGKPTFWLTTFGVSNDSTEKMIRVAERYDNAYIIDWGSLAGEHINTYILADGLHPTPEGAAAYAELIRERINEEVLTSKVQRSNDS